MVTAVAAAPGISVVAGAQVIAVVPDVRIELGESWVIVSRGRGGWEQLDPLPSVPGSSQPYPPSATAIGPKASIDVVATGWIRGCGMWARWTPGVGWGSFQPVPGCPESDPGLVIGGDGSPIVLTSLADEDEDEDYGSALAVGAP